MTDSWVDVDTSDVEARWRPLTDQEKQVASAIIQDAQDILETAAEAAGVAPPNSTEERRTRSYIRVVASMAIRVLQNPDGILSETIDDYTYRRDSAVSSGALYVSDAEIDSLRPHTGRRRRGAFSIRPY
jgi:hypothetical protein